MTRSADPQLRTRIATTAQAAWSWVLDQVREDDGPWVPTSVAVAEPAESADPDRPAADDPPWDRDGVHSGIGGLAFVLAEVRLLRSWTAQEQELADRIADRLRRRTAVTVDCTAFDGLPGTVAALLALGASGVDDAVARLGALADPLGWPQTAFGPPRYNGDARVSDATLGSAGVLLGALSAWRDGVEQARDLAVQAGEVLLREAEPTPAGCTWLMVPRRYQSEPVVEMPNFSHGVAGVATALALAGSGLGRPDLLDAARRGADHLISLGRAVDGGFEAPLRLPPSPDHEPVSYGWCHGPTGTALLFAALDGAGVAEVGGATPAAWRRRCLDAVRTSGVPERRWPGFWDNDGRCCGTAGVGEAFLDAWQSRTPVSTEAGEDDDLAFALHLADVLVERAVHDGPYAYWRFLEHRAADPLLPPGVGWMQGAAGIAAFLFRTVRVLDRGRQAPVVPRPDSWFAVSTPGR